MTYRKNVAFYVGIDRQYSGPQFLVRSLGLKSTQFRQTRVLALGGSYIVWTQNDH